MGNFHISVQHDKRSFVGDIKTWLKEQRSFDDHQYENYRTPEHEGESTWDSLQKNFVLKSLLGFPRDSLVWAEDAEIFVAGHGADFTRTTATAPNPVKDGQADFKVEQLIEALCNSIDKRWDELSETKRRGLWAAAIYSIANLHKMLDRLAAIDRTDESASYDDEGPIRADGGISGLDSWFVQLEAAC
ncbi:hypothetical protein LCGC14_1268090 [marine sediment metagenome]|uniref:Uncharacterized protein n=1 Tax=marine sediment metagenome TaxID=412755 RepID=A0A0F9LJS4_9ZZZZ